VVLDACVLLPASLRDTLLRLAETPCLYIPKWSNQIGVEVVRNRESRRKLTPERIAHLTEQVQLHFPEALIEGYEKLAVLMTNDPKDRHVAAAAVSANAASYCDLQPQGFPARVFVRMGNRSPTSRPFPDGSISSIPKQWCPGFANRLRRLAERFQNC
jgi:hypothetical protein